MTTSMGLHPDGRGQQRARDQQRRAQQGDPIAETGGATETAQPEHERDARGDVQHAGRDDGAAEDGAQPAEQQHVEWRGRAVGLVAREHAPLPVLGQRAGVGQGDVGVVDQRLVYQPEQQRGAEDGRAEQQRGGVGVGAEPAWPHHVVEPLVMALCGETGHSLTSSLSSSRTPHIGTYPMAMEPKPGWQMRNRMYSAGN
ncbi:MAG: hypothetical protein GEV00_17880 [Actinophytocola sp.]|nr:hypothetical protein [Actinophytocola sp.]